MGATAPTRDTQGAASLALSESLYFSVLAFALMPRDASPPLVLAFSACVL